MTIQAQHQDRFPARATLSDRPTPAWSPDHPHRPGARCRRADRGFARPRRHAIIAHRPDGVRMLDDRSANGTFVNDRPSTQEAARRSRADGRPRL